MERNESSTDTYVPQPHKKTIFSCLDSHHLILLTHWEEEDPTHYLISHQSMTNKALFRIAVGSRAFEALENKAFGK